MSALVALLLAVALLAGLAPDPGVAQTTNSTNLNCVLIVPENALTAEGLATPWQLMAADPSQGPCNMSNPNQQALVQGSVLDLDTGDIYVYNPLVVDQGTDPAEPPVVPTLPTNFVVGLWIGFNGNNLELVSANGTNSSTDANCTSGIITDGQVDLFSEWCYCNTPNFFSAAVSMINAGNLTVPPLGIGNDGFPCPSVRDFGIVDDDPSDTVATTYLLVANGTVAQNTAANRALFPNATIINNGRGIDAILVSQLDSVLGCDIWQAPDLADNNTMTESCALDELQAAYWQQPKALVEADDHMVLSQITGNQSLAKLNAFREGVGQPLVANLSQANTTIYCEALATIGVARLTSWSRFTANLTTPDPTVGVNFYGYMVARFLDTWEMLNCTTLTNVSCPYAVAINQQGLAVAGFVISQVNIIDPSAFQPGGEFYYAPGSVTLGY